MFINMIKSFVMILLVITLSFHSGCKKDMSPIGLDIHPFGTIEGVSLGASTQEVEAVLGKVEICARADGLGRNWYGASFFGYEDSCLDGLILYFIWGVDDDPNATGPLDMFILTAPYSGKLKEGVGIGSSVKSVGTAYGEPTIIDNDSQGFDYTYCFNGGRHFLNVSFTDSLATRIDIGYYKPMPESLGICD
jgi:hypothetical protein